MLRLLVGALLVVVLSAGGAMAKTRCLIVADVATGTVTHSEGTQCEETLGPASTFKLALAVIGFDAGLLEDADHPALPYKASYGAVRAADKATTTPRKWLADSVLWYSRVLVKKLGAERFAAAVRTLGYGNADVSGDPGANNGMTHSWLNSSLQISPREQAQFVRQLLRGDLPVSADAMRKAIEALPRFDGGGGWQIVGKTGTGYLREKNGKLGKRQYGWFIGWADRGQTRTLFSYLIEDEGTGGSAAGIRARDALIARWAKLAP